MTAAKENEAVSSNTLFAPARRRLRMQRINLGWTFALILIATPGVQAQPERYELGQRLRAFENAWERKTDAEARKRALDPLIQATTAFFSFRLGEAGKALDQARFALESDQEPPAEKRWATAWYPSVQKRLLDARSDKLAIELFRFCPCDQEPPA